MEVKVQSESKAYAEMKLKIDKYEMMNASSQMKTDRYLEDLDNMRGNIIIEKLRFFLT